MTLHEAIVQLLKQTERAMTTHEIADKLNRNKWYQKKDGSKITDFQIHGRTKNYPQFFNRSGAIVSIPGQVITKQAKAPRKPIVLKKRASTSEKDEHYILNICDKVLRLISSRQHKFNFLLGDLNINGIAAKLPVDAFYEKLNLVIEYRERQHSESITFFDKPNRMTVSGVHRGEQRKIYDERRRIVLPKHNIKLIEISYSEFNHDNQKRIIRDNKFDEAVIRQRLSRFEK